MYKGLIINEKNNFEIRTGIERSYAQAILSEEDYKEIEQKASQRQETLNNKPKSMVVLAVKPSVTSIPKQINTPIFAPKVIIHNERIDSCIEKSGNTHKIDKYMIHAIVKQESDYDKTCLSPAGACGLMQLMPKTAEIFGVYGDDIWNEEKNIDAGVRYYKDLLKQFNGNIPLALAGYNAGGEAVKKYGGIPPFKETKNYVPAVLKHYKNLISREG
ncbi:MAG TPA: lytic transglycosylase domain-containing protein [Paludibacter sp.]|nr:lytic transglycosylase domain-containing protein [Paludibacter sp.]